MKTSIAEALQSLTPGALWKYSGEDLDSLEWMSDDIEEPSREQILEEIKRLDNEAENMAYMELRRIEYPDFREYLDGIVKNDQGQIDKYIADCLAVKEKYPKPVEVEE